MIFEIYPALRPGSIVSPPPPLTHTSCPKTEPLKKKKKRALVLQGREAGKTTLIGTRPDPQRKKNRFWTKSANI